MSALSLLEQRLDDIVCGRGAPTSANELLQSGEQVLEAWLHAKGAEPTTGKREGFRLLALHRQGATGEASFNACRETCRELVFHYNLSLEFADGSEQMKSCLTMMALVANHLVLFVGGKMSDDAVGDFCCSSKPLHGENAEEAEIKHA